MLFVGNAETTQSGHAGSSDSVIAGVVVAIVIVAAIIVVVVVIFIRRRLVKTYKFKLFTLNNGDFNLLSAT